MSRLTAAEYRKLHAIQRNANDPKRFLAGVGNPAPAPSEPRYALRGLLILMASCALVAAALAGVLLVLSFLGFDLSRGIQFGIFAAE